MEPSVHIPTGTEKMKPQLCIGTLVGFAEKVVGFQSGTLDIQLRLRVTYVLLLLIDASLFNHIEILISRAKLTLSLVILDIYL